MVQFVLRNTTNLTSTVKKTIYRALTVFKHPPVCRYVGPSDHYLKNYWSQGCHISNIDWFGEDLTANNFWFTWSKIKVTRVLYVKQWFLLIILRNIYHRAVIFNMLLGLGDAMTPYDFGFTRLRSLVKNVYTCFLIIILRTIYHIAFIFHMLIGLNRDQTHIDIEVIKSKVKVRRITFVK